MRTYQLEQRGNDSKYYYIYQQLKRDIQNGELKKGEKLPSKRSFAEHLGVGLITVENAYQLLKEEGYIETRERSGYYVCELPIMDGEMRIRPKLQMLEVPKQGQLPEKENSEHGNVLDRFPASVYFKTVRSVISDYGEELLMRSPNEGCAILRNSIAAYLSRYRGIFAQPRQIIIGSGAEDLYGTVVRLLGKERVYGIEDPSYQQIQKVYEGFGASVERLRMGVDGIETESLLAGVLHVTPFHSYPSGVTAPVRKRYEYLNWARGKLLGEDDTQEQKRYIVEDDFDSEFFMPGKPIETLFMMDHNDCVIYINTFSKSLSPSIRMGYMILPENLIEVYERTSGGYSCSVPVLEQYALAEFINKGHFEQHLNRVRRKQVLNHTYFQRM